jgi:hypothetical protein
MPTKYTFPDKLECTQCGKIVSVEDTVCPQCGVELYPVEEEAVEENPSLETRAQPPKKNYRFYAWLGFGVGSLLIVLAGVDIFSSARINGAVLAAALFDSIVGIFLILSGVLLWQSKRWALSLLFTLQSLVVITFYGNKLARLTDFSPASVNRTLRVDFGAMLILVLFSLGLLVYEIRQKEG